MTKQSLRRTTVIVLAALLLLLNIFAPIAVLADDSNSQTNIEDTPFPTESAVVPQTQVQAGVGLGSVIITAAIVFLLMAGLRIAIKRLNRNATQLSPWLKVLDRQRLGNGHYLYLVELAGHLQVLAVSNQGVMKIAELEDAHLAGEIIQDLAWKAEQTIPPWWSELFIRIRGKDFKNELRRKGGEGTR